MTDDDLDRHIRAIIAREGGWVNDPDDSGGPTNYGITLGMWQSYCWNIHGVMGGGDKDVLRSLSADDARVREFYRWYFRTQGLAELIDEFSIPDELVPLVMDLRTLHSPDGCRKILRRGDRLRYAGMFKECGEDEIFITFSRMVYMLEIAERSPKDRKYVRGWMHRALRAIGMWPPKPETTEV